MSHPRGADHLPVVDVHAHLVPMDPAGVAAQAGARMIQGGRLEIDGHEIGPDRLYRPELLVKWLDANGIDTALISAPPPLYRQQLAAADAQRWTTFLNDGLAAFAAAFPGRLEVLAHLPVEHPTVAAREAAVRVGDVYAGVSLPAGGATMVSYADASLRPLWETLDEQASFAFLHPGSCGDGRLASFYAHNLLGNPYETAVAVAQLVLGGVAEDFPAIRFCLAHCGGVVPAVAGRWQRGFDTARPGIDTRRKPPRELLQHFCVDCVAHDHGLLAQAAQVFGANHILLGSDWPFPLGLDAPRDWLRVLPEPQQQDILSRNFAALRARGAASGS